LLTRTEEFDNAAWVSASTTNVTVTGNSATAPDGSLTAAIYTAGPNAGVSAAVSLGQQANATVVGPHRQSIWVRGVGPTIGKSIRFWWWFAGGGAATGDSGTITPVLTSEWQKIVATPNVTTVGQAFFRLDTGAGFGSFLAGEEMEIWHPQLETGSTATDYQRVGSTYDVTEAGQADNYHLVFDGVDDFMVTPTIDFTGTDEMSVFAGVRKLSDAGVGLVSELGTGAQAGSFYLAAPRTSGVGNYGFNTGVTLFRDAISPSDYASPVTSLISGLADLSADTSSLRVNGVNVASNSSDFGTGNFGNYPLYIGSRAGTSFRFNGHLYSLITRGALTSGDTLTTTEKYVASKTAGVSL
jgi:hypothetical protein